MNSISKYDIFEKTFNYYISLYSSILEKKQYNESFINVLLIVLMFVIEKHYFEREYFIESDSSFFDSIEWLLREKM